LGDPEEELSVWMGAGTIDDLAFVNSALNQYKDLIKIANRQAKFIFQPLKNEAGRH